MRSLLAFVTILIAGSATGCAMATQESDPITTIDGSAPDARAAVDARPQDGPMQFDAGPKDDAAPAADATRAIDAAMSPDADLGGGFLCDDSSQCTEANTCCFTLGNSGLCVSGEEIFGTCIPN